MDVRLGGARKIFYQFPMHQHESWEILYCFSGNGTATIGNRDYAFSPGSIFCIPPETPHCLQSEEGYSDSTIFTSDFISPDGRDVPVYQDDAEQTFAHLYESAYRIQLRGDPNAKSIVNAIADAMYQLMVGWSASRTERCSAVEQFQQLLMENISNCTFDLSTAIAQTGYCSSYFRKLFKNATGVSPVSYFNRMRVEYSKALLRQADGTRSIKEIAINAGFSDPYYFSRVFKEYTGFSPSGYPQVQSAHSHKSREKSQADYYWENGMQDPSAEDMNHT